MGYSARYHAASLAAVFLALGIGILIGVGFGDAVVSGARDDVEKSLKGDLAEARQAAEDLRAERGSQRRFERQVYPALVGDRLLNRRIALIAIGDLPERVLRDVREALPASGGRLVEVVTIRVPLDLESLAEAADPRFADLETQRRTLERFSQAIGRQLVGGRGSLLRQVRNRLLSRASGTSGEIDGAILVRRRPERLEAEQDTALDRFERGLIEGIRDTEVAAVGVERTDTERSAMRFFDDRRLSTVDNVDTVPGRVALVFALAGAKGAFGVKETADQLLPEPLVP